MRPVATLALATIVLALAVFAHGTLAFTQPDPSSYHRNGSLAFVDGANGIDLMHVDGGDREPLLENGGTSPVWSPDGARIAYVLGGNVRVVNSNGSNDHSVTAGEDPSWTPAGDLLLSSGGDIVRVPPSGPIVNVTHTPQLTETEPAEAPDSSYIAFTSNEDTSGDPNNPTAGLYNNLWIMDVNGDNHHLLYESNPGEYGGHPKWAPDSSRIAFISNADVWTTPPDGNNPTNVTNDHQVEDFPAWSPDGTLIAYAAGAAIPLVDSVAPSEIWTIDVDSRMRVNLTHDSQAHDTMPDWQPWHVQNGRLAFTASTPDGGVWTMDSDGTHRFEPLSLNPTPPRDVQWSREGTLIAFVTTDGNIGVLDALGQFSISNQYSVYKALSVSWFPRDQGIAFGASDQAPTSSDQEIYSEAKGSNNAVNLTNTPNIDEFSPAVSPSGSTIAFISDQQPFSDPPTRGGGIGIWTMDFDGNNRQFVTTLLSQNFIFGIGGHQLSWSPDGKKLAYTSGQDVWTINASDGSDPHNLTNDGLLQFDVSWSPDGKLIAFDQGVLSGTFQIWTIDPNSGHRTAVSQSSDHQDAIPSWQPVWAPGSDGYFPWGDNTCTGKPQPSSLLATLQSIAGVTVSHVPGCPWIGERGITSTNIATVWGDTGCTGKLDAGDIIDGLDYALEIGAYRPPTSAPAGGGSICPTIGSYAEWIPTG